MGGLSVEGRHRLMYKNKFLFLIIYEVSSTIIRQ